jgi:hypothetical protein
MKIVAVDLVKSLQGSSASSASSPARMEPAVRLRADVIIVMGAPAQMHPVKPGLASCNDWMG